MSSINRTINSYVVPIFSLMALFVFILVFRFQDGQQKFKNNMFSLNFFSFELGNNLTIASPPNYHPRAHLWLARNALKQNDTEYAKVLIAPLVEDNNPEALIVYAEVLYAEGRYDLAIEWWSKAGDYISLLQMARIAKETGHQEVALKAFRAAMSINAEMSTLPFADFLWNSYTNGQQEAETIIRKALTDFPTSIQRPGWMHRLGDFLRVQKRWDESEAVWNLALKENPNDWKAYIGLGWVYYGRGDGLDSALTYFEKAAIMKPENGEGYFNTAQVLAAEERFVEADEWFSQAISHNPEVRTWWLTRGNVARDSGNLPLALDIYKAAVIKFPEWASLYYEMALAFQKTGLKDEAIKSIESALKLAPIPNEWYYVRAGQIYAWAEDQAKAYDAYLKALEINPNNTASQKGIERLGK